MGHKAEGCLSLINLPALSLRRRSISIHRGREGARLDLPAGGLPAGSREGDRLSGSHLRSPVPHRVLGSGVGFQGERWTGQTTALQHTGACVQVIGSQEGEFGLIYEALSWARANK